LRCQFSIPEDDWSTPVMVQWRFKDEDIDGASDVVSSEVATHTITNFTDEGMYSCVVSTDYWSITSANVLVKEAGVYLYALDELMHTLCVFKFMYFRKIVPWYLLYLEYACIYI